MGRGLEGYREGVAVYLDTHIAVAVAEGKTRRFSRKAAKCLQRAEILISPMVVLELEFLFELGRLTHHADDFVYKLRAEAAIQVCSLPFAEIAQAAVHEKWTRDPFDRLIVANAKANGLAWLLTDDQRIHAHYSRALD